jgi:hypothetical protein
MDWIIPDTFNHFADCAGRHRTVLQFVSSVDGWTSSFGHFQRGSESNLVLYFGSQMWSRQPVPFGSETGPCCSDWSKVFFFRGWSHGWAIKKKTSKFFSGFAEAALSIFCLHSSTDEFSAQSRCFSGVLMRQRMKTLRKNAALRFDRLSTRTRRPKVATFAI